MKKTNFLVLILLMVLMLSTTEAFAQGSFGDLSDINFDDDVNDEPVPIFGHVFMLLSMTVALFLGYTKLVRK